MRILGVVSLCLLLSPATFAMTCMRPEPADLFAKADFIFEATVELRQKVDPPAGPSVCWTEGERCGPKIATLHVQRVWKGDPRPVVTVRSDDGCYCLGTYFSLGDRYIVFATRASGGEHDMDDMGACATELLANADKRGFLQVLDTLQALVEPGAR